MPRHIYRCVVRSSQFELKNMDKSKLEKLPKWAQTYISELEDKITKYQASEILTSQPKQIKPDVAPPESVGQPLSKGWMAGRGSSYQKPRVTRACSSPVSHNPWNDDNTNSQGSIGLYSTPRLALESLKYEIWEAYAKEIHIVVKAINNLEED